jgi:hypothetical protein
MEYLVLGGFRARLELHRRHPPSRRGRRPLAYGSGGQAGVLACAAHRGPVPVGHGCGGARCCCRPSSVAAAVVHACPAAVVGVRRARSIIRTRPIFTGQVTCITCSPLKSMPRW